MALTDNPYMPLYVKDWQTSNKLKMCSLEAHGLLINILCLMHRENKYGRILLRQKFNVCSSNALAFCSQLAVLLPFTAEQMEGPLNELLEEGVLKIDGKYLVSEKLEALALLSEKRSKAGKKGGDASKGLPKHVAQAKSVANAATATATGIDINIEGVDEKIEMNWELKDELFSNQIWVDEISMAHKTGSAENTETLFIDYFGRYHKTNGKTWDSVKDVKIHFNNWLSKNRDKINETRRSN